MHSQVKVLLPSSIFERARGDKNKLRRLIVEYMKRYPNYTILKVQGKFAICEMGRQQNG